jgi:hypothetical protein
VGGLEGLMASPLLLLIFRKVGRRHGQLSTRSFRLLDHGGSLHRKIVQIHRWQKHAEGNGTSSKRRFLKAFQAFIHACARTPLIRAWDDAVLLRFLLDSQYGRRGGGNENKEKEDLDETLHKVGEGR